MASGVSLLAQVIIEVQRDLLPLVTFIDLVGFLEVGLDDSASLH